MNKPTTLLPKMSEKAYGQSKETNTYVFEVPLSLNKQDIAKSVAETFEVIVTGVRVAVIKGKQKQSYRKRLRPRTGQRRTVKKAYVSVKAGQTIPIFAAIDEAEEKAEKSKAKAEKKAKKDKEK